MAEALLDELVEEILLRIAPDDPTPLFRAAVVCRRWRRLACDPGFRRRFGEFRRRRPPMLGFLCNLRCRHGVASAGDPFISSFISRSVPASPVARAADRLHCYALDSRHGRVLLHTSSSHSVTTLAVWDPITDEQVDLTLMPHHPFAYTGGWNAAVLGGGCHFLVVLVGFDRATGIFSCVYSSESDAWTEVASTKPMPIYGSLHLDRPVLASNALYMFTSSRILKYDLATQELSEIHLPDRISPSDAVLMNTEDGRLGFARVKGSRLYLWSWEDGSDKGPRWAQTKVIELEKILPVDALSTSPHVLGFADGLGLVFLWTIAGLFAIDPESNKVKKIGKLGDILGNSRIYNIIPHTSFCTPGSRYIFHEFLCANIRYENYPVMNTKIWISV